MSAVLIKIKNITTIKTIPTTNEDDKSKQSATKGPPSLNKNQKHEAKLLKKAMKEIQDFETIKKANQERFDNIGKEIS